VASAAFFKIADQVEALKDEADLTVSDASTLACREAVHGAVAQQVLTVRRNVQEP
jgi:hypothetical protein